MLERNKKEIKKQKPGERKDFRYTRGKHCSVQAIKIEILFELSKIKTESLLVLQITLYSDDASKRKYEAIWLRSTLHDRIICNYIKATGKVDLIYLHSPVYFHAFTSRCLAIFSTLMLVVTVT